MDTFKPELTFEESMKQVMKTLPPVIRDYLVQEKYTPVARSLMTKYGLRIDQGGVLEREILLLLMGVENPVEFTEALAEEAKLSKQVIDGIVQDVNNQIFVPLRKEEEKGSMIATEVRPSPQILKVEPQIQTALPKVEPQNGSHFKLENKIAPAHIAPLPPKTTMPRSSTLGDVVRSVLATPKPVDTDKLLEDHEEPHIELNKAEVPVNLPGVLPPVTPEVSGPFGHNDAPPSSVFKVEPQIQKPAPVAPIEPKSVPSPITSYSSDPYREPIDEPPTE